MSTPEPVRRLFSDWSDADRPGQASISWPRQRWIDAFSANAELFRELPDRPGLVRCGQRTQVQGLVHRVVDGCIYPSSTQGVGPHRYASDVMVRLDSAR